MKITTMTITPEMAKELLSRTPQRSRRMSQAMIYRLAVAIRKGEWKVTGDTIKLSKDGEVLDGQHRLWAVIEAGTAVETMILQEQDVPLEERGFGVMDERNTDGSK